MKNGQLYAAILLIGRDFYIIGKHCLQFDELYNCVASKGLFPIGRKREFFIAVKLRGRLKAIAVKSTAPRLNHRNAVSFF